MADTDNETIEDLPEEKKTRSGGPNPWLPVIVVVVLLPILSFALIEFVFIPRLQSAIGASHDEADTHGIQTVQSGGPAAPVTVSTGGGGHGGGTAQNVKGAIQLYHFDTIKTNLANPSTTLIIVKFSAKGSDPNFIQILDQYQVQLVDATLKVLSLLTRIDTQSPGIQNVVKNDLIARFNQVLGRSLVEDLYFVDFVTQ